MARPPRNISVAVENASACRAEHSCNRADQRCFASSIGTDNGDDGALFDFERYAIERLCIAVENVDIFHSEHQATVSAPR